MMMAFAARNEVMTHYISSIPAESEPCMWGSATLVTLVSRTCMTVTIITENVMAQRRVGVIGGGSSGSRALTPLHYGIAVPRWSVEWAPARAADRRTPPACFTDCHRHPARSAG